MALVQAIVEEGFGCARFEEKIGLVGDGRANGNRRCRFSP
jgi:hypothetical protein